MEALGCTDGGEPVRDLGIGSVVAECIESSGDDGGDDDGGGVGVGGC